MVDINENVIEEQKAEQVTENKKIEKKNATPEEYGASNIQLLEGLEAVRKRPGMYIGSTGPRGLHHLVWEIVDNAIDEALAGYCTHIEVELLPDNYVRVSDNGRGIPVGIHPKTGRSAAEAVFTVLHAGGKFDGSSYKVSGGLHGVGASVVNALSTHLHVCIHKNGEKYEQEYQRGKIMYDLRKLGPTDISGSIVTFHPDPEIFKEGIVYDYETLRVRLQQCAFLNKGLKITLTDRRHPEDIREVVYKYDGGIIEYVEYLNKSKTPIHPKIIYVSISLTFVDYRGLTVEEDTKMRKDLREAGVEYKVYKNRLLLKALEELGYTGYGDILEGTTAVAFGMKDEVSAPKIIVDTADKTKKMQVKGGMLNGERIDAKMVETLAKIPSKEVLISKLLYLLQSPVRSVAIALNAIAEKQGA